MTKKKKILWNSDSSKMLTGFGRNSKAVLQHLYDTGKYEIVEYSCAPLTFKDKRFKMLPWKGYGALPEDPFTREELSSEPQANYGSFYINELIRDEKPDIFIGVNDFWAFRGYYDEPWWNKIHSCLWITLDSLPIYQEAVQNAHKIKNFWVWSKFAENDMKRRGFDHVKTVHGAFDVSFFRPLSEERRTELRKRNGIEDDCMIFGFVFRNQGRKLVGTLLEAFSIFKKKNPDKKAKLLFHTSWSEGWSIPDYIEEFGINFEDVLTSHTCRSCKGYEVRPYRGEETACNSCGDHKSMITPMTGFGLSEEQMNEIYNLMDFYTHPITSGGLEMPLVEALLAGVAISTVNYSCGEEFCEQEFVTKMPFSTYREMGSQFIKSQPYAQNIAEIMEAEVERKGTDFAASRSRAGREWALENFDVKKICQEIENWIDSLPEIQYDYNVVKGEENENYPLKNEIIKDSEWAMDLVKNVFGQNESELNTTIKKILQKLENGGTRAEIHHDAIEAAKRANLRKKRTAVSAFFEKYQSGIAFIAPDSFEEQIACLSYLDTISKKSPVFIICNGKGIELFNQIQNSVFIPRTEKTSRVDWLKNLKSEEGKKRFAEVHFVDGGVMKNETN